MCEYRFEQNVGCFTLLFGKMVENNTYVYAVCAPINNKYPGICEFSILAWKTAVYNILQQLFLNIISA